MNLAKRLFHAARAQISTPFRRDKAFEPQNFHEEPFAHQQPTSDPNAANMQDPLLMGYYANLELPYGADFKAVQRAWKRLLRRYHPDLHAGDPQKRAIAEQLTSRLNQAYAALEAHLKSARQ